MIVIWMKIVIRVPNATNLVYNLCITTTIMKDIVLLINDLILIFMTRPTSLVEQMSGTAHNLAVP